MTLAGALRHRARLVRHLYTSALSAIVDSPQSSGPDRDLRVYTFSSERHLPEQVASLRSLLRHFGVPRRIVVVSDGSHTPDSTALLERVHPRVSVVHHRDLLKSDLPVVVARYADVSPMGVKLGLEMSMDVDGPTLYADADVLFFAGIDELESPSLRGAGAPRYLQDFDSRFLDKRLLADPTEAEQPANAGVLLLFRGLEWDVATERLDRISGEPSFLTEQTIVHLAMRASGGTPLPRERFVLEVDDEDDWRDRYGGRNIALRHYCFSDAVQRKLWLNVGADLAALSRSHPRVAAKAGIVAARALWAERQEAARAVT
jgi:hypothetical protein